jgi:chromosome segregation ATPase
MKSNPPSLSAARALNVALLAAGALLLSAVLCPGHAQAAKKGEKTADSLKAAAKNVENGESQVAAVTKALDQLVNQPNQDLRKPFKAYESAVDKLMKTAADAQKRREGAQNRREAYLAAWDEDMAKIQNEDIRNRSADRRQKVQQQLDRLGQCVTAVGDAYRPFEQNLVDIKTALGSDLTPGGVESIRPVANKARENAVSLRNSLTKLRQELESMGVAMSAKAAK